MFKIMLKIILLILVSSLLFPLTGCTTSINNLVSIAPPANQPVNSPDYYLQQARPTTGNEHYHFLLLATNAYIHTQQYSKAEETLQRIPADQLNMTNKVQYQLLSAQLSLITNQPAQAQTILQSLGDPNTLPVNAQIDRDTLLATSYEQLNQPLNSIQTRLDLSLLLNNPNAVKQNIQAIWKISQQLSNDTLTQLADDPTQPELAGWAALTLIARQDQNQPQKMIDDLRDWNVTYPKHPAGSLLTQVLPNAQKLLNTPQQIAVLLPMQGELAPQATAIWQGFLYAYYQMPANQRPKLFIYDTNNKNIEDVYQQAVRAGADFIVGPLTTKDVSTLADDNTKVPTLALNYSGNKVGDNFYEFGLSAESDAQQIAERIWQDGNSRVVTITLDSSGSNNLRNAFIQQFNAYGGIVTANVIINNKTNLDSTIKNLLDIPQSQARAAAIKKLLGNSNIAFTPRRRQDIDAIFLNILPNQAQQIIPLLQFYYAANIPVYASSLIYDGTPSLSENTDLERVMFADMPWVNNPSQNMIKAQRDLHKLWANNYASYPKLYAVGIDAYNLILQLNRLEVFPQSTYSGATGDIYIGPNHHLYRQLSWAKFSNGQIIKLPPNKVQAPLTSL